MNPLRHIWNRLAGLPENLAAGLKDFGGTVAIATKDFNDERQVHGFYRRRSADGKRPLGFGFYCPVRGGSALTAALHHGSYIKHCGRTDVLDTDAPLPTVRLRPRAGRYQVAADGTQAMPTDVLEKFDGEFKYEQSDPGGI